MAQDELSASEPSTRVVLFQKNQQFQLAVREQRARDAVNQTVWTHMLDLTLH